MVVFEYENTIESMLSRLHVFGEISLYLLSLGSQLTLHVVGAKIEVPISSLLDDRTCWAGEWA